MNKKLMDTYIKQGYKVVHNEKSFFDKTGNISWEEVKQDYRVIELNGLTLVKERKVKETRRF